MKLSEYQNPINGKDHNLFSLEGWISQILGVAVLILVVIFGFKFVEIFIPSMKAPATTSGTTATTRIIL